MTDLYTNTNYSAPISNLISAFIREYDISKANINILFKYGRISKNDYNYFLNADRMERQIRIGLFLRQNPDLNNVLKDGIAEARKEFFVANDIQDYEVLSIKNDAIFLINKIPTITKFDNIEFINKNFYTSFYRLSNKEYYYLFDMTNNTEKLDIKGIGDDNLKIHENYFLEFLLTIFNSAQLDPITETISLLKMFYNNYINRKLDINYYRRFDGEGRFDLIETKYSLFKASELPQSSINDIDISYNLNILSQLVKIYSGIYFQKYKAR